MGEMSQSFAWDVKVMAWVFCGVGYFQQSLILGAGLLRLVDRMLGVMLNRDVRPALWVNSPVPLLLWQ